MSSYLFPSIKISQKNSKKVVKAFRDNYRDKLNSQTYKTYLNVLNMLLAGNLDVKSKSRYLQLKSVIGKLHAIGQLEGYRVLPFSKRSGNKDLKAINNKYITEEQLDSLVKYLPDTAKGRALRLAINISYHSGLRLEECLSLKPADITINGTIKIAVQSGKGDKFRITHLPKSFGYTLKEFTGFSLSKHYCLITFARMVNKHNADNPNNAIHTTFHGLRHSFCSNMVNKGVPLIKVRDMAGHSSIAVTNRYLHASGDVTDEMAELGY